MEILPHSAAIICFVEFSQGAGSRVLFAHVVLCGNSIAGVADVLNEPLFGVPQVDDVVFGNHGLCRVDDGAGTGSKERECFME